MNNPLQNAPKALKRYADHHYIGSPDAKRRKFNLDNLQSINLHSFKQIQAHTPNVTDDAIRYSCAGCDSMEYIIDYGDTRYIVSPVSVWYPIISQNEYLCKRCIKTLKL